MYIVYTSYTDTNVYIVYRICIRMYTFVYYSCTCKHISHARLATLIYLPMSICKKENVLMVKMKEKNLYKIQPLPTVLRMHVCKRFTRMHVCKRFTRMHVCKRFTRMHVCKRFTRMHVCKRFTTCEAFLQAKATFSVRTCSKINDTYKYMNTYLGLLVSQRARANESQVDNALAVQSYMLIHLRTCSYI